MKVKSSGRDFLYASFDQGLPDKLTKASILKLRFAGKGLAALKAGHEYLLKGDMFTPDLIEFAPDPLGTGGPISMSLPERPD